MKMKGIDVRGTLEVEEGDWNGNASVKYSGGYSVRISPATWAVLTDGDWVPPDRRLDNTLHFAPAASLHILSDLLFTNIEIFYHRAYIIRDTDSVVK
jgi:hypothetical protein